MHRNASPCVANVPNLTAPLPAEPQTCLSSPSSGVCRAAPCHPSEHGWMRITCDQHGVRPWLWHLTAFVCCVSSFSSIAPASHRHATDLYGLSTGPLGKQETHTSHHGTKTHGNRHELVRHESITDLGSFLCASCHIPSRFFAPLPWGSMILGRPGKVRPRTHRIQCCFWISQALDAGLDRLTKSDGASGTQLRRWMPAGKCTRTASVRLGEADQ